MFFPHPLVISIVGSLRDREVACSASDLQGLNFESCVWRAVSSHSSHHLQEVPRAQFSLYVLKSGLKPDSFHFYLIAPAVTVGETEGAMDSASIPVFIFSFAYNFVRKRARIKNFVMWVILPGG